MKNTIVKAIKDILVQMAIDDALPLDMTQLDISKFDEAFKPLEEQVKKSFEAIDNVVSSCEEGQDGRWDCSSEDGKRGFGDMITVLHEAKNYLK
jgi:hypothetical protein